MTKRPVPEPIIRVVQRSLDAAFAVHSEIGPGCLESVYEVAMQVRLEEAGLRVERQKAIPFRYRSSVVPVAFRADLIVEDAVILELKVASALTDLHKAQLRTYLKLSGLPTGLLLNFGAAHLREGYDRQVHEDFVFLPPSKILGTSGPRDLGASRRA